MTVSGASFDFFPSLPLDIRNRQGTLGGMLSTSDWSCAVRTSCRWYVYMMSVVLGKLVMVVIVWWSRKRKRNE